MSSEKSMSRVVDRRVVGAGGNIDELAVAVALRRAGFVVDVAEHFAVPDRMMRLLPRLMEFGAQSAPVFGWASPGSAS